MAKNFDEAGVSEEETEQEVELEAETSTAQAPGGGPPKRTERDTLPPGDRGGRRPRTTTMSAGLFTRIRQFLHDTRAEMRRVSWPSVNEVKNTTIITLIAVIFFALYLFGVDRVLAFLIENLFRWLGGQT